MSTSRSLFISLVITGLVIGLMQTNIIQFHNQGIHAQTDFPSEKETLLLNDFMLLKNNINGEVITVRPNTKLMINEQDIVFQFKSHIQNDWRIVNE